MKAVILGAGRMGSVIAYAMNKLNFSVVAIDTSKPALEALSDKIDSLRSWSSEVVTLHVRDLGKQLEDILKKQQPDIVISSLPYFVNSLAASIVIRNNLRYCDLGGRVDVSTKINELALANDRSSMPVFTDLGLAPGWINILAEEGYRQLHGTGDTTTVEMMVGGLPDWHESTNNVLRYGNTWSMEGLINEYKDDCIILRDGKTEIVPGLEGLETVISNHFDRLEAFYTSGGASHTIQSMKDRGVQNCSYKTLRYPGHRDIVKFLIRDSNLDYDVMSQIFNACGVPKKDIVIMIAQVTKDSKVWREEKLIKSDDNFTAMQKATAFPISAVAKLMAEGQLEGEKDQHRDYYTAYSKSLKYSDVPYDKFKENLDKLLDF